MPQVPVIFTGAVNMMKVLVGRPDPKSPSKNVATQAPTSPNRKRQRESDVADVEEVSPEKKRRESMNEYSRREYPRVVTSISVPRVEVSPEPGPQAVMSNKKSTNRGGFQIRNTLSNNQHAATTTRRSTASAPTKRQPVAETLSTHSSVGHNVRTSGARGFKDTGERFISMSPRTNKRQKIMGGHAQSSPLDLTGEEDNDLSLTRGTLVAHNGLPIRRTSSISNRSTGSQQVSQVFANKEFGNVARLMEVGPTKKPRKARTSQRLQDDICEEDMEPEVVQDVEVADITMKGHVHPTIPIINLGEGVDNPSTSLKRSRPGSLGYAWSTTATNGRGRSHSEERTVQQGLRSKINQSKPAIQPRLNQSTISSARPGRAQSQTIASPGALRSQDTKLNNTFIRDTPVHAGPKKPRATDSMKEVSGTFSSKVSAIDSSSDELAGPTNVRKIKHLSNTTQKTRTSVVQPQTKGRSRSPSDIRPTKFTTSRATAIRSSPQSDTHAEPFQDTMPITTFYAKSCVLTTPDISLRYNKDPEKQMDVLHNGEIQLVRNGQCSVSLTDRQVQKIYYSIDNLHVYVTGSMDSISNGQICISFESYEGVTWFLDLMCGLWDNITVVPIASRLVDKQFRHTADLIRKAWDKEHDRRISEPIEEDEHIRYEEDSHRQRSSPAQRTISKFFPPPTRRTTRQSFASAKSLSPPPPERWSHIHQPKRWSQPVTYPKTGPRRVTVDFQDLERLDEGEFLNDNLVSFALKRMEETIAPEHKSSVYFFNSFFYTSLMKKNGKVGFNYEAVQRWTKNQDIFTIPFIVVPINLNFHWFVAIICNLPNLDREFETSEDDSEGIDDTGEMSTPDTKNQRITKGMRDLSVASESPANSEVKEDIFTFGDDNLVETGPSHSSAVVASTASRKGRKKTAPPLRKFDPEAPTIITLDSFGTARFPEIRNLKDYLKCEAENKRSITVDRDKLQGVTAKGIPEQDNYCDCGVYLVGYIEQFVKNPRAFVNKVLRRDSSLGNDFSSFNPSQTRANIRNELLRLSGEADEERLASKKAKMETKKSVGITPSQQPATNNEQQDTNSAQNAPTPTKRSSRKSPISARMEDKAAIASDPPLSRAQVNSGSQELEMEPPRALTDKNRPPPPLWTPIEQINGPEAETQSTEASDEVDDHDMLDTAPSRGEAGAGQSIEPSSGTVHVGLQNSEDSSDSSDNDRTEDETSQAQTIPESIHSS